MVHTHSAHASFTRSMRFSYEVTQAPIRHMVLRRTMLLEDDRHTYSFIPKQTRFGRFGQYLTWIGIVLGRGSQRLLFRFFGRGYSANGGWVYHVATIEKMLAAHEKNPREDSKQQLKAVLSQYIHSKDELYLKQLFFCQCAASRLKPDPRNQYLPVYAKYLLEHLGSLQDQPPQQATAGAGTSASGDASGGAGLILRQYSDPLIRTTVLPPNAPPPLRPKLRPLGKSCWDTATSFFCCCKANGPTSPSSGRETRVSAPKSPPVRSTEDYIRLEDSDDGVEMKTPDV